MAVAVSFHGVRLTLSSPAAAALDSLLAHFRDPAPRVNGPEVAFDVIAAVAPTPPSPGRLLFASERVRCALSPNGYILTSADSWLIVERAPLRVRGEVTNGQAVAEELLHAALLLALRELSFFELHAAALASEREALLLVGPSGSGKSTTALALLRGGLRYLGDDRVLLRDGALHSYPAHFRATEATRRAFPELAQHVLPAEFNTKRAIDPAAAFRGRHCPTFHGPTVLLFPRAGDTTELVPVGARDAFERLLLQSGTLVLDGHPAPRQHLAELKSLAERSHAFELSAGPEWLSEPASAAAGLLDALGSRSSGRAA